MHRKSRNIPFLPVAQIAGVIMVASLTVAAVLLLFSVTAQQAGANANWAHVMYVLTMGYRHIHGSHQLFQFYLNHHALAFLRSGVTSGSGGKGYLWWLTTHHVAPVDW